MDTRESVATRYIEASDSDLCEQLELLAAVPKVFSREEKSNLLHEVSFRLERRDRQ